ncbi:hypothetical protein BD414DRAFT_515338 [Trametes punicea]|nr:hypothetical protein BD414DRAFT_515338 [Trametes punicea]
MPIHSPVLCLRAVDPSQALLLLSLPSTFHLLNWETKQRIIVHMLSEEEEELWNGVVGATFLTSRHILLLKAHSIEVCTLLDSHDPSQRPISPEAAQDRPGSSAAPSSCSFEKHMLAVVHSHYLPSTTFRGASFAQPVLHHVGAASSQPELSQVSTSFLAFDVLRGLFHFSVSVTLPPSLADMNHVIDASTPIDVDVKLLASHNMALPIATHPPLEGPFRPTESGGLFSRSGLSHGTRGFVSSCALGPSGRRGVWVERRRGAVRRVVYGFDAVTRSPVADSFWYPEGAAAGLWEAGSTVDAPMETSHHAGGRAAPIKGREMYEVNSYDLRDDITHIAFAEATGLIALGTRKGDIRVLCRAEAD